MRPVPLRYQFEHTDAARRVLASIADQSSRHQLTRQTRSTTYYDTFDWRIFRLGGVLFTQSDGRHGVLHWQRLDGSSVQRSSLDTKPGFVWDLPRGSLHDSLEPVLEMRRLLPIVTVETKLETLHFLDERRKTVARLHLALSAAHPARGTQTSAELPVILQLCPLRGYDGEFEAVRQLLEDQQCEVLAENEFTRATHATKIEPGSYTRKLDLQLDPTMRADDATRVILRRLLGVMRDNEPGLRQNLDSEFLHDFRVAVRRTRSALSQIKGVFPPETVEHFRTEFSWLGQVTGPTRDLDVYQLKMPGYRASLPEHMRSDLDPLEEFLDRHQRIEHGDLVQLLDSDRYRSLIDDWQDFLDQPAPQSEQPESATTILDLASRRIWRSARKVLKKGAAIQSDSPAESLHRLRIECKKLRYLLEFFRSLYPNKELESIIDSLKSLQDNLGDFNDFEVQQEALKSYAQTMLAEKLGTVDSLMAMGRLVERLEQGQRKERQAFHKRFDDFSNRKNRRRLKRLFKDAGNQAA
jgi:CHAD domain-containing protein